MTAEQPARARTPTAGQLALVDSRERVREATRRLLVETVRVGIAHASPALGERFETLATWAQGAEYVRLSRSLKRVADELGQLLDRTATASTGDLFGELARTLALVTALEAAAAAGAEPDRLVGRARNEYEPVARLRLIGVGGFPWRAGSGYHGLTVLFWDPEATRWLSWTDARPLEMRGWTPRERWTEEGPWSGMPSPAASVGRQVVLTDAKVTAEGRISGTARTAAHLRDLSPPEVMEELAVYDRWDAVARDRDGSTRSLLDVPSRLEAWTAVRPAGMRPARFDAARQTLVWPLLDASGRELTGELEYSPVTAHAVDRIEALAALPDGAVVVARVHAGSRGLRSEPLAVIDPMAPRIDCLHFEGRAGRRRPRAGQAEASPPVPEESGGRPQGRAPRPLVDLLTWLEGLAERGTEGMREDFVRAALASRHEALRGVGLTVFGPPDPDAEVAELLLRSRYLEQQVRTALTGDAT